MKAFKILFMLIALIAFACDSTSDNQNTVAPFVDSSVDKVDVTIIGNVTRFAIEGGGYAILGDSSQTYEAINLPERFHKDGLKVVVEAKYRNDLGSFRMVGPIIQIRSIKQR